MLENVKARVKIILIRLEIKHQRLMIFNLHLHILRRPFLLLNIPLRALPRRCLPFSPFLPKLEYILVIQNRRLPLPILRLSQSNIRGQIILRRCIMMKRLILLSRTLLFRNRLHIYRILRVVRLEYGDHRVPVAPFLLADFLALNTVLLDRQSHTIV